MYFDKIIFSKIKMMPTNLVGKKREKTLIYFYRHSEGCTFLHGLGVMYGKFGTYIQV